MVRKNERPSSNKEAVKEYQIKRAVDYVEKNRSKNGSEDRLEVCIISDLLRIIKN